MSHRMPYRAGPVLALAILSLLSLAVLSLAPLGHGWGRDLPIIAFLCGGWLLGPLAWAQTGQHLCAIREGRADPCDEGLIRAARLVAALSITLILVGLVVSFLVVVVQGL